VTITTTGRPVYVGLISSSSVATNGTSSWIGAVGNGALQYQASLFVIFLRDSNIAASFQQTVTSGGTGMSLNSAASAFNTIDVAPAGTHTYTVQVSPANGTANEVKSCRLVAYEL
jgi:hypothetical protein